MLTLRSSYKRLIIFIIIALSLYTGYRLSDFQTKPAQQTQIDTREAQAIFDSATNYKKTTMNFRLEAFSAAEQTVKQVLSLEGVTPKYFFNRNNSIISLLEIPTEVENAAEKLFKSIPGLYNEKTVITPRRIAEQSIDVTSHINQNKLILGRLQERVKSPHLTTREIGELQIQMRSIQTTIDSLSSIQSIEKQRAKHLVFATIVKAVPAMAGGRIAQYRNLSLAILGSFVGYTIFLIIVFYGFLLLNKLMSYIGLKSAKSDSRHAGHKYGQYGGYGYGYGSKRIKKKKRVQVKRENSEEDNDNEDEPEH